MIESENTELTSVNSVNSTNNAKIRESKINSMLIPEDNQQKLIDILSEILSNICEEGKLNPDKKNSCLRYFIFKEIPGISIKDYLERLLKYTKVSDSTIILILIYIDRICNINNINLNYYNIHKLILASFVIAIKFNEDSYNSVDFYAKLGGVSKNEMFHIEFIFLILINYNLFVEPELFEKYQQDLLNLDGGEEDEEDNDDDNNNINDENDNDDEFKDNTRSCD